MAIEYAIGTGKGIVEKSERIIKSYMKREKIKDINDEFSGRHVCFWSDGDVEIDGKVSLKELNLLVEIIKSMGELK